MKIKKFKEVIEFIGSINNVDLEVTEDQFDFCIVSGTRTYATVSKHLTYSIDTGFTGYRDLSDGLRSNLLGAMYEFAKTPLDEREDEKHFYLNHRFMCGFEKCTFFNIDSLNKALYLSDKEQAQNVQTQFTQEEIEEIKEKYNTDLKDFEIIEVED